MAQAVVLEKSAKVAKTHKGVQAEFYLQTNREELVDRKLRAFLSDAYEYKYAADYSTDIDREASYAEAEQAVADAARFFAHFKKLLGP